MDAQEDIHKIKLAIVIPYYKLGFFKETLDSIANQTCKDFNLYIGDDASDHEITSIIDNYKDIINIAYTRFPENLGGSNLVKQWERCVNLTNAEEWIWLFSDDDIMEPTCVEMFYKKVASNPKSNLLHFDVLQINSKSEIVKEMPQFPEQLSSEDFFTMRVDYQLYSFVVEYIFKRDLYNRCDGFQNFDLAWCADDATWIKFGKEKGIERIPHAKVKWRYSNENLSSMVKDESIVLRKLESSVNYIKWAREILDPTIFDSITKVLLIRWALGSVYNANGFNLTKKKKIYIQTVNKFGPTFSKDMKVICWLIYSYFKDVGLKFFGRK